MQQSEVGDTRVYLNQTNLTYPYSCNPRHLSLNNADTFRMQTLFGLVTTNAASQWRRVLTVWETN